MPQQLVAKVKGHSELERPQSISSSSERTMTFVPFWFNSATNCSKVSLSLNSS